MRTHTETTAMAGDKRILQAACRGGAVGADEISPAALYRLATWLSPAYPVGAFAYSSGIEWAVESGDVTNGASLHQWLETMLIDGAGINDGIIFSHTHRAIPADDTARLIEIAELAAAFAPTRERWQETTTLGRAFVDVTQAAWPCAAVAKLTAVWNGPVAYPVAVGTACAGHGIPLVSALHAFLTAICANWISAGVRLIPLGHTEGQHVLRTLEPVVAVVAKKALAARIDELASATFRADLASARHETQYTRLFRS